VSRELRDERVFDLLTSPQGQRGPYGTEFLFELAEGAALMTMIQSGVPSDELREEHGRGVPHGFDRLERALAAGGGGTCGD